MKGKKMNYIVLDWRTYLADPEYWQKISNDLAIPLHIGEDRQ